MALPLFAESPCYHYKTGKRIPGTYQAGWVYEQNLASRQEIIVNQGGTDSGKTVAILKVLFYLITQATKEEVRNDPEGHITTVVAESVPNLKKGAMLIANNIISASPVLQTYIDGKNKTDREIFFKNGAVMQFVSYEDAEQAKQGKRKYLFVNECQKVSWNIFWQLAKRTRYKAFIDYNPTARFWAHDELIDKPDATGDKRNDLNKTVRLIISDHRHNPFLPLEEHLKTENIKDPERWKVYARGLTGEVSGRIFTGWTKIEPALFPKIEKMFWGIDYGYTNDPTAVIKCARLGNDVFLHESLYQTGGLSAALINEHMKVQGYDNHSPLYSEHDPDMIRQLKMLKVRAVAARKGAGSIRAGIDKLKEFNIFYTSTSVNLEAEYNKYMWAEDPDTGKSLNVPADGQMDHALDATRYAVFSHFYRGK